MQSAEITESSSAGTEGEQTVPELTTAVRIVRTSLHCRCTVAEACELSSENNPSRANKRVKALIEFTD